MGSSENFQAGICSGGWWNPRRSSLFCAAPLSEFMWSNSALLGDMDNEQAEMKQQAASAATTAPYSRSDDSDDHHSSSAEHFPVMTSNYRQIFQDTQKPLMADFGVSDYWLQADSLLRNDASSNMMHIFKQVTDDDQIKGNDCQEFYNLDQFDTTNFVASAATDFMHQQPPTTANPAPNNFWDSWMISTDEIGAPESHQLPAPPALFEDQKPYNYGVNNRFSDRSKMTPKIDNKNILGTKRKNTISDEPYKRARFETPSSLPTFKVRKEKLGDRITALQQLVSPFGKTDTASVLHEAVEYIKFLHDQVSVLRTPYMQNGTPTNQHQQMQVESKNTAEGPKDLRSRGLCLVPIPSTFPVNQ
ncbi:unnamed protein product [Rhodiola kirilowii]